MALLDFEVFIKERLAVFNPSLDLSRGSPIDSQVIQPLLRRIGTDPFTLDASTFIVERLSQEFPDIANSDGDAVSDLLVKPALLLWDPIIREIQRIKNSLSFKDPSTLTLEEADALGANIFARRSTGSYAVGVGRIYFSQPQPQTISTSNFFTSGSGLHFFPTSIQSISAAEMMLNVEGSLYYFDVNLTAEFPGDGYNIGPLELVTIANVSATVRVTNKNRFNAGLPETDAVTFIGNIEQSLSEKSLVTSRGISARLPAAFPEITGLNVIGFSDPEMQRDVISGGGLGAMLAYGTDANAAPDGEFKSTSRRVTMPSADFLSTIGPAGNVTGWVLTIFNAFPSAPYVRDLPVARVVDGQTLEVTGQVLRPGLPAAAWALRKSELTLSHIPGGILFPDNTNGTVSITNDQIHIGGCTDTLVRGTGFDNATLTVDVLSDELYALSGTTASMSVAAGVTTLTLEDLVLAALLTSNYEAGDTTDLLLNRAGKYHYIFEVLDGPGAGVYNAVRYTGNDVDGHPTFEVLPTIQNTLPDTYQWRLSENIHVNLVEPKQLRVSGTSGNTVLNLPLFYTNSYPPVDFDALGVAKGDILRVPSGRLKGDYVVQSLPLSTRILLDRSFSASQTGVPFTIFRPNGGGGSKRPLIRTTSVGLLDSKGQESGVTVPYAKPVEVVSNSFQNVGNGVKVDLRDARLGIVSQAATADTFPYFTFSGSGTLYIQWTGGSVEVPILSGNITMNDLMAHINGASMANPDVGYGVAVSVLYGGKYFIGIIPPGPSTLVTGGDDILTGLFGNTALRTASDIRSKLSFDGPHTWEDVTPAIDADTDAVWVLDGLQAGFYGGATISADTHALQVSHDFSPEIARAVRVGARSIGSARFYFLEPTSASVNADTRVSVVTANNVVLNYLPDPTLTRQVYPALPNGTKPTDGVTDGSEVFVSASADFPRKGILVGDILRIDYVPITGGVIADPVAGLALKQLRLSYDNQSDKIVTFVNDVATAGAVSQAGVAEQINAAIGENICSIQSSKLVFNPTKYLIVRQQNGSTAQANVLLGFDNNTDTTNLSDSSGDYQIIAVAVGADITKLTLDQSVAADTELQFSVIRRGEQRITTTTMATQKAVGGLYYWDVELLSEGPGNLWNLSAGQDMLASGYVSDGYYLTTSDPSLSFSPSESVWMTLSPSVMLDGVDDDPDNATKLAGGGLTISYEYSSLVQGAQHFLSAESERVINDSPLARSLVPHYVRFDLTYTGGSSPGSITPDLEALIKSLPPTQALESSDIQGLVAAKGATYVQNPVELMAVVYGFDRSVTLVRSSDSINTGRLSAFIPDAITLTRRAF